MSAGLAPLPKGLDATLQHEGVLVRFGPRPAATSLGILLLLCGLVFLGFVVLSPWFLAGGLALPLGILVVVQARAARATVRVTPRQVQVEGKGAVAVRLDDLTEVTCVQNSRGDWTLSVRTRKERYVLVSGHPETHLVWLCAAIEEARRGDASRAAAEGREWTFLRQTPDAIDALRGKD